MPFGSDRILSKRKLVSLKVVLVTNEGTLYAPNWMLSVDNRAQTKSLARNSLSRFRLYKTTCKPR
jgi:hypothetical protein